MLRSRGRSVRHTVRAYAMSRLVADHLAWQRAVLASPNGSFAEHVSFLVLRPGDRFVVCGEHVSRKSCTIGSRRRMRELDGASAVEPYLGNCSWDAIVIGSTSDDAQKHFQCNSTARRPPPGLGNVLQGVVSALAVAIASRRVLLIDGWDTATAALGPPLTDVLLPPSPDIPSDRGSPKPGHAHASRGGTGAAWREMLAAAEAEQGSHYDTFASHDGLSAASPICHSRFGAAEPAARVWRIYANEYFVPLLRANPHPHRASELLAGSRRPRSHITSDVWTDALHALIRPRAHIERAVAAFHAAHLAGRPSLGFHLRCVNLDGQCSPRQLAGAASCALSRLGALSNASTMVMRATGAATPHTPARPPVLFLATLHRSAREHLRAFLHQRGYEVVWYGENAQERQETSALQEESRWIDALLLRSATSLLLSRGSTFGYVVRALVARRGERSALEDAFHVGTRDRSDHGSDTSASASARPTREAVPWSYNPSTGECGPAPEATAEPVCHNARLLQRCGLTKNYTVAF